MHKSFSFKGITRNSDNLLVSDGECMELINFRVKDGCLEPLASEYKETELETCYEKVYWHSVADVFLCIEYKYEGKVHFYDNNYKIMKSESGALELFPDLKGVERIEFIGHIVCLVTSTSMFYIIFESGGYRWLGERPPLPELSFSSVSAVFEATTDDEYIAGVSLRTEDDSLRWGNVSKGYFDQCLSLLHSHGYYVDRALFRYALRLFDGNYFCYSPIYYLDDDEAVGELARDSKNFQSEAKTAGAVSSRYVARVQGFLPSFHLKSLDLSRWENVIVGIDLFSTPSIYGHKVSNSSDSLSSRNGAYYAKNYGCERYVEKSGEEIVDDVQDAAIFYKIAEFNLQGVLLDAVKDVSATNLALCDALPDESGSMVNRSASYTYSFNGRLHLAGVREKFMKAYAHCDYLPPCVPDVVMADRALVVTKIKCTTGISVVKKEFKGDFALGLKDGSYLLTPYIMYPDARAFETTFIITLGDKIYRRTFPLKQHKNLNLAQYVNSAGTLFKVSLECDLAVGTKPSSYSENNILVYFSYSPGTYEIRYTSQGGWYYGEEPFVLSDGPDGLRFYHIISTLNPQEGDSILITIERSDSLEKISGVEDIVIDEAWEQLDEEVDVEEVNACEVRGNVLKVSAVDNPFFFAAKNTYTPSKEDILAVCSNTVALSQGQFGQHPLYVFSKDGIWAMEGSSSGDVTYVCSHPVSRELCTAVSSLCCTDSGIVFLSLRGVMLLQGNNLTCLSDAISADSHFMQNVVLKDIYYRVAMLVGNQYALSRENFSKYIEGDIVVGYIAAENELWVSNPDYSYSYIYSLNSGVWSKIGNSFTGFVNCYPHQLYTRIVDDKSYVAIIDNVNAVDYSAVTLFTRPQLWGTKLPKRIMQLMLHASARVVDTGNSYMYAGLACYLLCSNDGVNFKLVAGVERDKDFSDIVFPFFPTQAYKYFVIALSGVLSLDSRIVGAELSIAVAWENRLR